MKIIDANIEKNTSYNADIAIIGAGIIGTFLTFLLKKTKYFCVFSVRRKKKGIYMTRKIACAAAQTHT